MDKISIIMATYQGEKYIREQLESLLASDYKNFEVFIYDDGSFDQTVHIATEYQNQYPGKVHVCVNDNNLGLVGNFLSGLQSVSSNNETKSEYYMFCDQDDVWFSEKMRIMRRRMKGMEKKYGQDTPLLVFSDAVITDEYLKVYHTSYHQSQNLDVRKRDLAHLLMENKCSGCMLMINHQLASMVKKIPVRARYHDWWLALIAASFGHLSYVNQPLIMYRQHKDNLVGNQGRMEYLSESLKNPLKHKNSFMLSQSQAEEFLEIYQEQLSENDVKIIYNFANLYKESFIKKRVKMIHYGYFKSSFLRNIGVFLLI